MFTFIDVVFKVTPLKKSSGLRSGYFAGHLNSLNYQFTDDQKYCLNIQKLYEHCVEEHHLDKIRYFFFLPVRYIQDILVVYFVKNWGIFSFLNYSHIDFKFYLNSSLPCSMWIYITPVMHIVPASATALIYSRLITPKYFLHKIYICLFQNWHFSYKSSFVIILPNFWAQIIL